ncbi:hypothetical protein EJB05_12584, partial [Eragrostis curvula]
LPAAFLPEVLATTSVRFTSIPRNSPFHHRHSSGEARAEGTIPATSPATAQRGTRRLACATRIDPIMIPQCKMTHVEHPRSWSDLPTELVGLVLCRLPAYPDRVRFGAVCRHWSFSSAQNLLPPPLPCLTFPDGTFVSLPHGESFQFHDSAGYHSTCGEWLIFSNDGTYTLKNPFSKVTMTLPNMSCFCLIDEPVEIINGRVIPEGEMTQKSMNMNVKMSLGKVIVCSMLLVAAFVDIGSLSTVALCRPGAASWLVSGLVCRRILFEMMFCEGKLYVIDEFRDLLAIHAGEDNDSGKISISRIERLIENLPFSLSFIDNGVCFTDYFLVECKGALLLVSRTIPGIPCDDSRGRVTYKPTGVDFKVFEADFNSSLWVGVTCLGDDQALFVGKRYSRSVDVSQYNKLKGNCIFMLDDGSHYWFWKGIESSYIMFNMSTGTTNPPVLSSSFESERAPAAWLFTK